MLPESVLNLIERLALRKHCIRVAALAYAEGQKNTARKCAGICEALEKLLRDYEAAYPFGRLGEQVRAALISGKEEG